MLALRLHHDAAVPDRLLSERTLLSQIIHDAYDAFPSDALDQLLVLVVSVDHVVVRNVMTLEPVTRIRIDVV